MNKRISVIFVILFAVVGSVAYLLLSSGGEGTMQTTGNQQTNQASHIDEATASQVTQTNTPGAYLDYSDSIGPGKTKGTTLLFFHAPWCPQCRDLEADIQTNGVPNGVTIIKVDYDTNQDLRKRYGVTLQTTFVSVDEQGNLIKKFVAYDDPSLQAVKENLL